MSYSYLQRVTEEGEEHFYKINFMEICQAFKKQIKFCKLKAKISELHNWKYQFLDFIIFPMENTSFLF